MMKLQSFVVGLVIALGATVALAQTERRYRNHDEAEQEGCKKARPQSQCQEAQSRQTQEALRFLKAACMCGRLAPHARKF